MTTTARGGTRHLFVNANEQTATVDVMLRGIRTPVLYSPLQDKTISATFTEQENGTRATFTLDALETAIVLNEEIL